ncbi:MAG: ABC transporter ATP-binding protein/permease [Actinomycetota bacterium]|nr:ABC transporter ATP-binding protein/permease [Actinomycetota bacterium]
MRRQRPELPREIAAPAPVRPRRLLSLVAAAIGIAWRAARRELLALVAAQLLGAVAMACGLLLGRHLLSVTLHADRAGSGVGRAIPAALALTAATAAIGMTRAFASRHLRLLGELCMRDGHDRVLGVAAAADLAEFDDPDFHDRLARARAGMMRLPLVVSSLGGLLGAAAGAGASVVALLVLQPLLAPLALLVLVPAWAAAARRGRLSYGLMFSLTAPERERMYLAELLIGRDPAKEIRAFGLGGFVQARHDRLYDRRIDAVRQMARRQLYLSLAADVVAAAIIGGALLGLIALAGAHEISLAGAGATAIAIALLGQRLAAAGASAGGLSESALFIEDLLRLIDERPHPPASSGSAAEDATAVEVVARGAAPPAITLDHVTFTYPSAQHPALREVSMRVDPGEVVALVGRNGSGKTTLAKLAAGLYLPQSGSVRWDGVDTADCDRAQLVARAAIVFQDFMRYALPAYDNIAMGRSERFDDGLAVRAAARRAGSERDIARLPHGYDTLLGPQFDGGVDLSLGQWQRIALARLFFRDAPFVILDEPTAALDAQAEEELFAGIRELLAGRSVVLISHRFSTVRQADRIYVLQDGSITELGTHDELLAGDGPYAKLFNLQAAPYR